MVYHTFLYTSRNTTNHYSLHPDENSKINYPIITSHLMFVNPDGSRIRSGLAGPLSPVALLDKSTYHFILGQTKTPIEGYHCDCMYSYAHTGSASRYFNTAMLLTQ